MLDEIGEMSPGIQAKFLRVLEGHPFERVGGSKPIKVDVRVIAATNRDLERDVAEGRFRRDLFFRLRVLEIVVPALRKRRKTSPCWPTTSCRSSTPKPAARSKASRPRPRRNCSSYLWPGNVRELKNVIERAVVLCRGQEIDAEDLLLTKLATAGDTDIVAWPANSLRPALAGRHRTPPHLQHAQPHRLEQEQDGHASWASNARRSTAKSAATAWTTSIAKQGSTGS